MSSSPHTRLLIDLSFPQTYNASCPLARSSDVINGLFPYRTLLKVECSYVFSPHTQLWSPIFHTIFPCMSWLASLTYL